MVHVYTGNGKGKTTASFGVAIRMLGHGKKVCLIQFMKKNYEYGEINFFSKIDNIDVFQYGSDKLVEPGKPSRHDIQEAHDAMAKVMDVISGDRYDLVIADEINVAVAWGLLSLEEQKKVFQINDKPELIMTGRAAHPDIIEQADLVTEMKELKHYYQAGIIARKGIEF